LWQVIAMREVEVVDLVEGMILQYDVLGINDVVLLTRGTVLNNLMIEKLIRADVYYVYIKDDNIKKDKNENEEEDDESHHDRRNEVEGGAVGAPMKKLDLRLEI